MSDRLVRLTVPAGRAPDAQAILSREGHEAVVLPLDAKRTLLETEVTATESQEVLDRIESAFSHEPGFRCVLLPIEAILPRPAPPEASAEPGEEEEKRPRAPARISRDELIADIEPSSRLTGDFLALTAFAAVVAGIGVLNDNVAAIIGAMVIAPMLGPAVAISLAVTLGDVRLGKRAAGTILAGTALALAFSAGWGALIDVDPTVRGISDRTVIRLGDIVLGLVSGSAGVLAFTSGALSALVGVMVAVALLPPLVVCGLLLGAGRLDLALGAGELFLANVVSISLAGVLTFLAKGVHPKWWWERDRARRMTRIALSLWALLLLALVVLIVLGRDAPTE
ncbi:MAG: TIGR00341 family protein [Planctomycetota bacterium JB042]